MQELRVVILFTAGDMGQAVQAADEISVLSSIENTDNPLHVAADKWALGHYGMLIKAERLSDSRWRLGEVLAIGLLSRLQLTS